MISNDFLQIAMMILNLLKLIWSLLGIDNKEKSEKKHFNKCLIYYRYFVS